MNYETAKKLKEAGFPFKNASLVKQVNGVTFEGYLPTLSELIEACGEEFHCLDKDEIWWAAGGECYSWEDFSFKHVVMGSTPEEAVANLWLALNSS